MPRQQLEAPRLHLERASDHEGSSRTDWYADYGGGVPGPGVVVEGVKEVK